MKGGGLFDGGGFISGVAISVEFMGSLSWKGLLAYSKVGSNDGVGLLSGLYVKWTVGSSRRNLKVFCGSTLAIGNRRAFTKLMNAVKRHKIVVVNNTYLQ